MGSLIPAQNELSYRQYLQRIGTSEFIAKGSEAQQWVLSQKGASEKILKVLEQAVQL